jgi:hypothetical protein
MKTIRTCMGLVLCGAVALSSLLPALAAERSSAQTPTPTTNGATERGAFKSPAVPLRRLPPVASEGGCEPRYRNGLVGTCVNAKPCRGFGAREDDGSAVCICYVRRDGCADDERCDAQEGQCVKDDESEFGREH